METKGERVLIMKEGEQVPLDAVERKPLTAAQKKREKLKAKKQQMKAGDWDSQGKSDDTAIVDAQPANLVKPTGGKPSKDAKKKGKGPSKKQIAAIQAAIQNLKDEEERFNKEEDEKERQREELEAARLAKLKEEEEKKERKKQKAKERKARLKAEGKWMTAKQKMAAARGQQLIDSLKAQGAVPEVSGEKKPRPGTRIRKKSLSQCSLGDSTKATPETSCHDLGLVNITPFSSETKLDGSPVPSDDKLNAYGGPHKSDIGLVENTLLSLEKILDASPVPSDDNLNVYEGPHKSPKNKEEPHLRIENRRLENEKNRSVDVLRSPVVCVLGHVDTGKTKILDKLRSTHVQDGEAGGITQQIGATNVPIKPIIESAKFVKKFATSDVKLPGLLLIDTPGHESFANLRSRGSSLCDIAVLVVDIMHGLEPQTIESLNLLKKKKTPFIVALNKVDRIYDWKTSPKMDVRDVMKNQPKNSLWEFQKRTNEVILQFAEQGMNVALFYENSDPCTYISMVPTSALTGEGMGNLMALIVEYSQSMLTKRLMFSNELQATVLEVKAIPGLGTTIDVILVNGMLREGDTLILAGTDGPIVTQIRSLLTPQPMKELRVKNSYTEFKQIQGAIGVKVAAKGLEAAIAGMNVLVANYPDEVDPCKEEVASELGTALGSFRVQERGVYVQASTLGSLEALLEFLKVSQIPFSGLRVGPVVKKDVMKASIMLEHDSQYAVILAFDVKIERDAQDLADHLGVKIFQADIIYHLFDKFTAYQDDLKAKKRDEFKSIAVFPCKLKILPQFIFKSRDPIVVGVSVEAGTLKEGTPLCVPEKNCLEIGHVTSIEINHKNVDRAVKGQDVCIKIEPVPGHPPKALGRHFEATDVLVSKISRESIDACKEYFREDLQKADWHLMVELKKTLQIM